MQFLGDHDLPSINPFVIKMILFDFFEKEGDWETGLSLMPYLQKNISVASPLLGEMLAEQAKESVPRALSWVVKHTELPGCENAAHQVGLQMALADNPAKYLEQINAGSINQVIRLNLFRGLAIGWIREDFDSAAAYFSEVPVSPEYDGAIYEVVGEAAAIDAKLAMTWAESIQDAGLRHSAIVETAQCWHQQNEAEFLEWKKLNDF